MAADSVSPKKFDHSVLAMVACPVCYEELRLRDADGTIVCADCMRAYPIVDGIPVLISERAVTC